MNTPELLIEFLRSIFRRDTGATLDIASLDPEYAAFGEGLQYFAKCFFECDLLAKTLTEGNLGTQLPDKENHMSGSLKSLHATLKHLTWQTKQVAKGDYSQRVDYMGEFSTAFNMMVQQLDERQSRLELLNNNLQGTVDGLQSTLLKTMVELLDCRDNVTGGHIERTQIYLKILMNALTKKGIYAKETSSWNIELVLLSAQLHDLGKIAIEDPVLRKPGKLSPHEFEIIKTHTTVGSKIIGKIKEDANAHAFLEYAGLFAVSHHEKWDGSGYPNKLSGTKIPLLGRLLAVVDVYDALVSERPYKKAFTHEIAVKIIKDGSGNHFDPAIAKLFVENEKEFKTAQPGDDK